MARPATEVASRLAGRAHTIELHVRRLEAASSSGALLTRDLDISYAGAFLTWCTALERSIEALFVGLVVGRLEAGSRVSPLVEIRSDRVAHSIIRGSRPYVDWLPFDGTARRAQAFLSGGRPFSELGPQHATTMRRTHKIRNAIAHDSSHSLKVFQRELVEGAGLPTWQYRPGGYLRGQHAGQQNRLEALMSQGLSAFSSLCG